jgi:hypothetical protein
LHKLAEKKFASVTPAIQNELLDFYRDPNAPNHTKDKPEEWRQTLSELAALRDRALQNRGGLIQSNLDLP